MEIGHAINVDIALAMNVFANIETFTKNMHRNTQQVNSESSKHGTDRNRSVNSTL